MPLDFNQIFAQMVQAASQSLGTKWSPIKDVATSEFKKLSQNIIDIESMKLAGTITEEQAQLQIQLQKNVIKTVMLTEAGLGLLAVESAINAALGVVTGVVNRAIGWQLL